MAVDPSFAPHTDSPFEAIHSLALRGRVSRLEVGLEGLIDAGLVQVVDGGFQLSERGHSSHRAMLERERPSLDLSRLAMTASAMPALNRLLVRHRYAWNNANGATARRRVISQLGDLVAQVGPMLARTAMIAPRFGVYGPRLGAAVARLRAGDDAYAFAESVDSVGVVWRELNEDYLQTLGRAHEFDYGNMVPIETDESARA